MKTRFSLTRMMHTPSFTQNQTQELQEYIKTANNSDITFLTHPVHQLRDLREQQPFFLR